MCIKSTNIINFIRKGTKMKKYLIIIGICLIFFSSCDNNVSYESELKTEQTNSNFDNEKTGNSKTNLETESEIKEQLPSKIDKKQMDDKVTSIIYNFVKWKSEFLSHGTEYTKLTFKDLIKDFKNISQENSFAKEFIDKANNIGYNKLNKNSKLIFDLYIKYLFRVDKNLVTSSSLGKIKEAWYGYYKEENSTYFYIKFKNYPSYKKVYLLINREEYDGKIIKDDYDETIHFKYSLKNKKYRTLYINGDKAFKVKNVGVDKLNKFITENKDFINYLINYRDNFYAPIINKKLEKEEQEKREKEEQERILKEKIPQIGMTAAEVRGSKWGTPDHINKDTYSWGTTEQWVYNSEGYVYFENGIVTSVSER